MSGITAVPNASGINQSLGLPEVQQEPLSPTEQVNQRIRAQEVPQLSQTAPESSQEAPSSLLTADANQTLQDANNNPVVASLGDSEESRRQQFFDLDYRQQNQTFMQKMGAAWDDNFTVKTVKGLGNFFDNNYPDFDPNFQPEEHLGEYLDSQGLVNTEDNRTYLSAATSHDDMAQRVDDLKQHQKSMQILSDNPTYAIASGLVDPISMGVGVATMGAGNAFQVGRLGLAIAGALEGAGYVAADNAVSIEKAGPEQYMIGAMGGFALGGVFGSKTVPNAFKAPMKAVADRVNGAAIVPAPKGGGASWINAQFSEYDTLARMGDNSKALADKLMDSGVGGQGSDSAASYLRLHRKQIEKEAIEFEQAFSDLAGTRTLGGKIRAIGNDGQRQSAVRLVRDEMIERTNAVERGLPVPELPNDPKLARAVTAMEAYQTKAFNIAKQSDVNGTRDITATAGYVHRSWKPQTMLAMVNRHGDDFMHNLLRRGIKANAPQMDAELADAYAKAIVFRIQSRAQNVRSNFGPDLGDHDVGNLIKELEGMGYGRHRIEHIRRLVNNSQQERGRVSYTQSRIPMDQNTVALAQDGSQVAIKDLIDGDVDSLAENYAQRMVGLAALAKHGYGTTEGKGISSIESELKNALVRDGHSDDSVNSRLGQLINSVLGDFTGVVPERNRVGSLQQGLTSWAGSTALAFSGLWQIQEFGRIAHTYGLRRMLPAMREQMLRPIQKNPDLADSVDSVFGINLWGDVRARPWMGQMEAQLASHNGSIMRFLHQAKQATPVVNGMHLVHQFQSRLVMNLSAEAIYGASRGNKNMLRILSENASTREAELAMEGMRKYATGTAGSVKELNLAHWDDEAANALQSTLLKVGDSALLMGRTGEGSPWARSPVGRIFGMFLTFVGNAHNKIMRRTVANRGYQGLALLMAYEYPLAMMDATAKSALQGNYSDKDFMQNNIITAAGNLSSLGMFGMVPSLLGYGGGRGGMSAAILSPINSAMKMVGGVSELATDPRKGWHNVATGFTGSAPLLGVIPGAKAAVDALTNPN